MNRPFVHSSVNVMHIISVTRCVRPTLSQDPPSPDLVERPPLLNILTRSSVHISTHLGTGEGLSTLGTDNTELTQVVRKEWMVPT